MPFYLDTHKHPLTSGSLLKIGANSEKACEVILLKIINAEDQNKCYCLLDAPDRASVEEFHLQQGLECDWIEKVTSIEEIGIDSGVQE